MQSKRGDTTSHSLEGYTQESGVGASVGEDVEKLGGMQNRAAALENRWAVSQNDKHSYQMTQQLYA